VVFTSDNGGERFSDNWPLVGGKMDLTEGGIRVPWIAHWPAVIAPGGVSAQHCMTMDWSATLLDAAAPRPIPRLSAGRRVAAAGAARPGRQLRRPLHWRMNHRGQRALRDGDWKYLRSTATTTCSTSPPTSASAPTTRAASPRLAAMRAAWETWNATMPPIPDDATVSLGYSVQDMPQR
jgi:arylsulfatase A-like enzyme